MESGIARGEQVTRPDAPREFSANAVGASQ
jgi:hypothetical protein